ncbi:hypothetical protein LTR49_026988 [Elasticomyces elasticus]|nr:hypothetical protein LTR49_026988 [Elasticomyces elasticus]
MTLPNHYTQNTSDAMALGHATKTNADTTEPAIQERGHEIDVTIRPSRDAAYTFKVLTPGSAGVLTPHRATAVWAYIKAAGSEPEVTVAQVSGADMEPHYDTIRNASKSLAELRNSSSYTAATLIHSGKIAWTSIPSTKLRGTSA